MKRNWLKTIFAMCLVIAATQSVSAQGQGDHEKTAKGALNVQVDGGKIIVVDADGEKQEIDIPNAKSVTVTQRVESKSVNGQEERKSRGMAIIVGPDGERHEIELDGPMISRPDLERGGVELNLNSDNRFEFRLNNDAIPNSGGKFFIGVVCEPVSDALRSQLKLESEVGLTVTELTSEGPSAQAGIEKYDILLYADDTPLTSLEVLSKSVNQAGDESKSISIEAIRAGKEMTLSVKPKQRADVIEVDVETDNQQLELVGDPRQLLLWRRINPGVMIENGEPAEMGATIQVMLEQLKAAQHEMTDLTELKGEMDRVRVELLQSQKEMQAAMEEALRRFQQDLKEMKDK